ncbi:GNAT family N-acetyltransferase [Isachenkonia alkalipeptolytica]
MYEKEKPVARMLTHDDGAMGFFHVLPEHCWKGYAWELSIAMMKKLREQGEIPFVHIQEDNQGSMSLSRKIGFVKERLIQWVKINLEEKG